jgi:hypothetical protein
MLMLGTLFIAIGCLTQQIDEPILRNRLLEEEERAGAPGLDGPVYGSLSTDHDRLSLRIDLAEMLEQLDAVDVRKRQTRQHDVGAPVPEEFLSCVAAESGTNIVAFSFKDLPQPVCSSWLFVDNKYAPAALAVQ